MFHVHPTLRPYVSVAFYLSVGVGAFGILFLILGLTRGEAGHSDWPFFIFGVLAIVSGILGTTVVPRHYRTATRVVANVPPVPRRILLELESDSDSTSLYATLLRDEDRTIDLSFGAKEERSKTSRRPRYALILPIWNVESLLNEQLSVSAYINPVTNRPVAFRTAKGMLWCIPSWQGQA